MQSPKNTLNSADFYYGLIWAVAGAVFAFMAKSVENLQFTFNWTEIWHTAVCAAVLYLADAFRKGPVQSAVYPINKILA